MRGSGVSAFAERRASASLTEQPFSSFCGRGFRLCQLSVMVLGLTVWMDFNPLSYLGVKRSIPVSNDIAFDFYWDEQGCGVVFRVEMKFEGYMFVLYEQFNRAERYPDESEDGA